MQKFFGCLPDGAQATLYSISCGGISAEITDYGASLVRLLVPDRRGVCADIVLGYDNCSGYRSGNACLGATVGRNANRISGASFQLGEKVCHLTPNENGNNLHSGPDFFHKRLWKLVEHTDTAVTLRLLSPDGDQGFPGDAVIQVTYALSANKTLTISYSGYANKDTVFNLTNHSYFNLAGHDQTDSAMNQILTLPSRAFAAADSASIPTGELRSVDGTPMDFRTPKALGRDIGEKYDALNLQSGYDHSYEVFSIPCAILEDPVSGRTMSVSTDCPAVQLYTGNFLDEVGKDGVHYGPRSGVALETQFFPDSVNRAEWKQPFTKAGERYLSETKLRFL